MRGSIPRMTAVQLKKRRARSPMTTTLSSPLPFLWERVARIVRCETGEGSRRRVMSPPLIRLRFANVQRMDG
jgi:hypothetical protein